MSNVIGLRGSAVETNGAVALVDQDVIDQLEYMLGLARKGEINCCVAIGMKSIGKCHYEPPYTILAGMSAIGFNIFALIGTVEMLRRDLGKMVWDAEAEREQESDDD